MKGFFFYSGAWLEFYIVVKMNGLVKNSLKSKERLVKLCLKLIISGLHTVGETTSCYVKNYTMREKILKIITSKEINF